MYKTRIKISGPIRRTGTILPHGSSGGFGRLGPHGRIPTHQSIINLAAGPSSPNFEVVRLIIPSLVVDICSNVYVPTEPQCVTELHIRHHSQIKRKPDCPEFRSNDHWYDKRVNSRATISQPRGATGDLTLSSHSLLARSYSYVPTYTT
jgi:hypothetical protein